MDMDPGVRRVEEFHRAFDCVITQKPRVLPLDERDCRVLAGVGNTIAGLATALKEAAAQANANDRPALGLYLIRLQGHIEETAELAAALADRDIVAAFDALIDSSYFVDGTYLTLGLAAAKSAGYDEVHRSNMSKLGADGRPIVSPAGRVEKGPRYSPPDLRGVLRRLYPEVFEGPDQ